MSENIIEVRNLSKKFKNHLAVKNITFDLKRGEIKGILGANGAGKTTTITMLLGLLTPTSGSVKILSTDIAISVDNILTLPDVGVNKPSNIVMVVVFPAPLAPKIPFISPRFKSNVIFLTAR